MRDKINGVLITIFSLSLSFFILWTTALGEYPPMVQMGIPLLLGTMLVFLFKPLKENTPLALSEIIPIIGIIVAAGYVILFYDDIANRIGITTITDTVISIIGVIIILEMARRMTGLIIPGISLTFLAYCLFGGYIPGPLGHNGFSFERIARYMWLSGDGVFGIPTATVVAYIIIFIIFAAFLEGSGTGKFFIDLSYALTGRIRSGPALTAVIASSFFGTINGSAVANVAGTGVFTIPLMKRAGYKPYFAGAVEATASTGGQIMPPVMGAGAFIMAEITGIPYVKICVMALVPALLYYWGVGTAVHFEAVRLGLKPMKHEEGAPTFGKILKEGWVYLSPIIVLVTLLVLGYSPGWCAFIAILVSIGIGLIKKSMKLGQITGTLVKGAKMSLELISLVACVGIIVGSVTMSGIGVKFSELVISLSGGHLFIALFLVMVASIILGMGVPTVAAYLLLVVVTAPALIQMGISLISAHFFVYYFGCLSAITPPVALAAYAGAGIAGANPMQTGLTATRICLTAFIVPFMFAYNPVLLLEGTLIDIIVALPTSFLGVLILSMATIGSDFRKSFNYYERGFLLASAVLLIKPGIYTDISGIVLFIIVLIIRRVRFTKGGERATL
jgi:TRAP transporter 4TM/12TM fusion protein